MRKTLLRCLALVSALILLGICPVMADEPEIGDRVKFIPILVTVTKNAISVEGYFINMNEDLAVKNFSDVEISLYRGGDLWTKAKFGEINQFTVEPLGMVFQKFTFTKKHKIDPGTYVAKDNFYCVVSMHFYSVNRQ